MNNTGKMILVSLSPIRPTLLGITSKNELKFRGEKYEKDLCSGFAPDIPLHECMGSANTDGNAAQSRVVGHSAASTNSQHHISPFFGE